MLFAGLCSHRSVVKLRVCASCIATYYWIGCHYINMREIRWRSYGCVANTTNLIHGQLICVAFIRDTGLIPTRIVQEIRPRHIAYSAVRDVVLVRQDTGRGYRQRTLIIAINAQIGNEDSDIVVLQGIVLDLGTGSE